MPTRRFWFLAASILTLIITPFRPAGAQRLAIGQSPLNAGGLMGSAEASALGLEQVWTDSISLQSGVDELADIALFVDDEDPLTYMEVIVPIPEEPIPDVLPPAPAAIDAPDGPSEKTTVLMRIRYGVVGPGGRMVDEAEANRLANNEMRRLKRRGYEASKRVIKSPRILLYSLTQSGTLQRRDAETGRLDWQIAIGQPGIGYNRLGISHDHVLITNGANLYQVSALTGRQIGNVVLRKVPSFGAISVGDYGILHAFDGSMAIYDLRDISLDPYLERVSGGANARPVSGPLSDKIAWPTREGFVYVTELSGTPSTLFRLQTDGVVTGSVAAGPGEEYFFGTDHGQVYGIHATNSGEVLWTESLGVSVTSIPVLLKDRLFVVTEYGELFCLDLADGRRIWERSVKNVGRLDAAFDGKLYCEDLSGRFLALNALDGSRVATPVQFEPTVVVTNRETNRLYLVGDSGLVQCLREAGSELPTLISGARYESANAIGTASAIEPQESASKEPAVEKPKDTLFGNPAENPFGGANEDPFGGANDPFGGAPAGDDPFGGDPFN